MTDKKYWIALMKADNNYYVLSSKDGTVNMRNTKKGMVKEFENLYKYSSNTSASVILNNLQFEPSIIGMPLKKIEEEFFDLKKGTRVNRISSPSGSFYGLGCNGEKKNIEKIFDEGEKPNL